MYGKLFQQMYDGTLATKGPWQALVTFQQLVILADDQGIVDMTPEALSRRTTIPLEIIKDGLYHLEQPDPQSRTPDLDGRRIERLSDDRDWGWRLVNYLHYRAIRSAEERREYMRNYQRARRARVNTSTGGKQSQPIAEVEVEVEVEAGKAKASSEAVITIPTIGPKGDFGVTASMVEELRKLYPAVDVEQTLREIRGWNIANPARRKTPGGMMRHINAWMAKEQNRG